MWRGTWMLGKWMKDLHDNNYSETMVQGLPKVSAPAHHVNSAPEGHRAACALAGLNGFPKDAEKNGSHQCGTYLQATTCGSHHHCCHLLSSPLPPLHQLAHNALVASRRRLPTTAPVFLVDGVGSVVPTIMDNSWWSACRS